MFEQRIYCINKINLSRPVVNKYIHQGDTLVFLHRTFKQIDGFSVGTSDAGLR